MRERRDIMTEEAKPTTPTAPRQTGPHFIPKLKGKKVVIRLVSGGQPVTGILEGYNPYEILIQTVKGQVPGVQACHSCIRACGHA